MFWLQRTPAKSHLICFAFLKLFYAGDGVKKSLLWHALKSKYLFFFQFGNNNNYMNMAEANNAFLAANEVDVFLFFFFIYAHILLFALII